MEAFSLLKYWRGGGVRGVGGGGGSGSSGSGGGSSVPTDAIVRTDANLRTDSKMCSTNSSSSYSTTTTTIRHLAVDTDDEEEDDDGPFFDLEFSVPDDIGENDDCDGDGDGDGEGDVEVSDNGEADGEEGEENESTGTEEDRDFDFTVSPGSTGSRTDPNLPLSLSPSDDLFFKGQFVPIDTGFNSSESGSKLGSLLKPATKLRVFMLGFKKAGKPADKVENNGGGEGSVGSVGSAAEQQKSKSSFTVKFKVEEVPIVSLFTRENSSRNHGNGNGNKTSKQSSEEIASEEKKFAKAVLQKYLKMVKPLYVRVSKRYGDKLGFSGQLSLGKAGGEKGVSPISSPKKVEMKETKEVETNVTTRSQKQGNLTAGLRVVCKHLGKSRSASSAAVAPSVGIQSKRQDDSLLQQQDGIQSAILHCKRSFNGSRDSSDAASSSLLSRSTSDPSHEKSKPSVINSSRVSLDEALERQKAGKLPE